MSSATTRKPQFVDRLAVQSSLDDLVGLASLLLDASRSRDVSQSGVNAAARYIETIHDRLLDAFNMEGERS